MKKVTLCISIFLIVLISGCAREKTFLDMDFQPGSVHQYIVSTTYELTQNVAGTTVHMNQTLIQYFTFEVVTVDDPAGAVIRVTYDEIGLESDGPFGSIRYYSWKDKGEVPGSARAFSVLLDKQVTMRMAQDGTVREVTGTDTIIDEMIAVFDVDLDSASMVKARKDLENQFGDQAVAEIMKKIFPIYPQPAVGPGDAWGGRTRFVCGLPVSVHSTWHVRDFDEGVMVLDAYGIVEPNSDVRLKSVPGTELYYILRGTKNGDYTINARTGWIINGTVYAHIQGVAVLAGMVDNYERTARAPMEITETVCIEMRDVIDSTTRENEGGRAPTQRGSNGDSE